MAGAKDRTHPPADDADADLDRFADLTFDRGDDHQARSSHRDAGDHPSTSAIEFSREVAARQSGKPLETSPRTKTSQPLDELDPTLPLTDEAREFFDGKFNISRHRFNPETNSLEPITIEEYLQRKLQSGSSKGIKKRERNSCCIFLRPQPAQDDALDAQTMRLSKDTDVKLIGWNYGKPFALNLQTTKVGTLLATKEMVSCIAVAVGAERLDAQGARIRLWHVQDHNVDAPAEIESHIQECKAAGLSLKVAMLGGVTWSDASVRNGKLLDDMLQRVGIEPQLRLTFCDGKYPMRKYPPLGVVIEDDHQVQFKTKFVYDARGDEAGEPEGSGSGAPDPTSAREP